MVADHAFDVGAEAAEVLVRAGQSEGGHAEHDDLRVALANLLVGDAGLFDGDRDVVLHHHVADLDQLEEGFAPLG